MLNVVIVLAITTSFVLMIVGFIKPGLVIRWGEKKTRPRVLMVYGGLFIALFVVLGMTGSPNSPDGNKSAKEAVNKELETKYTYDSAEMRVGDWCMEHQFPNNPKLSISKGKPDGSFYEKDGKKYYLFTLTGLHRAVDILVDPYTGDLLFNDVGIKPYSLNTWYGQYRKDYGGANKTSSDSRLAGRWVANDGARFEFSSNGMASTSLNIWEYPWNQKRDNMNWSTNNGRLSLTVSTQMTTSYSIIQDNTYGEILTMEGKQNFKRKQGYGTTGDGLYGVWMPTDSGGSGIQFRNNNTGTNQFSGMGEFTWTDIGSGKLRIEYVRTQYFDYTIENGRLIIFTNNGNIVFTKVGS